MIGWLGGAFSLNRCGLHFFRHTIYFTTSCTRTIPESSSPPSFGRVHFTYCTLRLAPGRSGTHSKWTADVHQSFCTVPRHHCRKSSQQSSQNSTCEILLFNTLLADSTSMIFRNFFEADSFAPTTIPTMSFGRLLTYILLGVGDSLSREIIIPEGYSILGGLQPYNSVQF